MATMATLRPVNPLLQGKLVGYFSDPSVFIAENVLPKVPNAPMTGTYQVVGRNTAFGTLGESDRRAPLDEINREIGISLSSGTYQATEKARGTLVDRTMMEHSQLVSDPGGLELQALEARAALDFLRIKREIRVAELLFTQANWSQNTSLAAAAKWSAATGNPIVDVDLACQTVAGNGIPNPNTIVIGHLPFRALLKNVILLAARPSTADRSMLTMDDIKALFSKYFGITNVFVGDAMYNNANAGQTPSMAYVWGDKVWVGYLDFSNGGSRISGQNVKLDGSAACNFEVKPLTTNEYEVPDRNALALDHRYINAEAITAALGGYLIQTVTL